MAASWPGAAIEGRVWVCDPAVAGICVDVHGLCYHSKPVRHFWCGLPPGAMLMSEGFADVQALARLSPAAAYGRVNLTWAAQWSWYWWQGSGEPAPGA